MAIFIQEEFDGGALGSKGMYRDSSLKEKAVKRAINVEPTDEGTLRSRPLTQEIPFEPYTLNTRQRVFGGQPPRQYQLPLDQPFLPGTRTLPFTWRGDKYALHYTPYHYLSFLFDRDVKPALEVPYPMPQEDIQGSINDLRNELANFIDSGYLRSIESIALHRASSLYNHLYTQGTPETGGGSIFRNYAMVDWTRSTYLHNVYIVFREDGTVVRQGRPHSIRTVEPPAGVHIPSDFTGGGVPYLTPLVNVNSDIDTEDFISGTHELVAAIRNRDHLFFGGMTDEEIEGSLLALSWSGEVYRRYQFPENVRYEFRDLGDTFTFVDVMGTVEPDIAFAEDIRQSHAVYFPVTTIAGGEAGQPFPYERGLEVSSVRVEEETIDLPRPEAAIDSVPRRVPVTHRGPLLMPSFGAEKGDPTSLDPSGSPSSPVPPARFSPGHVTFVHGYTSQYEDIFDDTEPLVDSYAPLGITLEFTDTRTGLPLDGELFKGFANPITSGAYEHSGLRIRASDMEESDFRGISIGSEIRGSQRNRLRVYTNPSLNGIYAPSFRTIASTGSGTTDTPHRIGLVLRRPSSFYVDNAPRMRLPENTNDLFFGPDVLILREDTQAFFHGAIPDGFKGLTVQVDDAPGSVTRYLGPGFHMVFDKNVSRDYLNSLRRIVFRQEDGEEVRTFHLENEGPSVSLWSDITSRPDRPRGLPHGIASEDQVVHFVASTTTAPKGADNLPTTGWGTEIAALAGVIGRRGDPDQNISSIRKTFRFEIYTSEVSLDFPFGRPYWSGFHFDEYAELLVSQQFLTGDNADSPARIAYFPGVTLRRSEASDFRSKRPVLRDEGSDYLQIGAGRTEGVFSDAERQRFELTYRLRRLALASLAGGSGYGRAGIYASPSDGGYDTIDVETYTNQCQLFFRRRIQVTRDGTQYNALGSPEETSFRFLLDLSNSRVVRYAQGAVTNGFANIAIPFFTYGGLPNYDVYLQDIDSDPDVLAFWYPGLIEKNLLTPVTGDSLVYEPRSTGLRGDFFHRIGYTIDGAFTTSEDRYNFPLRIVDDDALDLRVGEWNGLGERPPRTEPIRVMPYYSDSLLSRAPMEGLGDEIAARSYAGRICLTDLEARAKPVPIHFESPLPTGAEDTVLDESLDDFRPLLDVGQTVPKIWRVYQSRLFWFARRSFGASTLLDFGDFDSYARSTTEGPLALRLAGDNLIPTGQDDTHIHWAYVYEGNLLIGMNTQIRTLSRENPFTGGQIPTTLVRLPSTEITPVYVRNFLFKVRGDLRGIERLVPTFQYGQRIISTTISNPVYLDYLQDATISYMLEHPTQHAFYVGTSDDRILYGHVAPDGIVSWTEMNYPDRVGPLQRDSFGIFYRTETNLLRYITGGSVSVEPQLSCEIELLPLSLIGRRPTGRLNEGSQQADASVIVDMPVGEELIIGRGQTPRSQVIYSDREIREPYRESPEGNEGMLLRYTGSGPFHLVRVSREDNTLIDPRQLYFAKGRPDPRTLGLREI